MMASGKRLRCLTSFDNESRIKNLMWTTGSSRMQYKFFGDVVTFDTIYKTNLYDMPFGLFVGVNNHFQSIILCRRHGPRRAGREL